MSKQNLKEIEFDKNKVNSNGSRESQIQETREYIARLNVIDDVFFQKVAEDLQVCQEILRIILEEPELEILESQVQDSLKNLQGRSVILDVNCRDSKGVYYNIEVQKTDNDDHQRRVRYNSALLTSNVAQSGIDFIEIPDVKVVYISKFDLFQNGRTIYHVKRILGENGHVVENGVSEIYVNTKINDGTEIAELMQFFECSTGYHSKFPHLSNRVRMFKETEEGVKYMSGVIEELRAKSRKEGRAETALKNVQMLVLKKVAATEEDACQLLELDYKEYSDWKRNNLALPK